MIGRLVARTVALVTTYSKTTVAIALVLTLAVGAGATSIAGPSEERLGGDSTARQKLDYVRAHYGTGPGDVTTATVYVRDPGGNVLSKASLLASLRFQREVVSDPDVAPALAGDRPVVGVAPLVAKRLAGDENASPAAGIAALEGASEAEVRSAVAATLAPGSDALRLLPSSYEPGSATAESRFMAFTLREDAADDAEAAIFEHVRSRADAGYFTLGGPALQEANQRALSDSLELIGPLALLFILVTLTFAYRDLVDVVVGMVGVVLTLVWMFGLIGWLNVPFGTAALIAPILLIGLSIDYGIHVFMRYREERGPDEGIRGPMRRALGGVAVALALVTVTTALGFLSNLTSPLAEIRSLAVATSLGVAAALFVFVTFVPALKVELDGLLERVGIERRSRALGTDGGLVGRALTGGVRAARLSAVGVVVMALVLGAAGGAAWTGLDKSLTSRAAQPPEWQQSLPEPFAMHEYEYIDRLTYVEQNFRRSGGGDDPAQVLVQGAATDPATLRRIDAATAALRDRDVVFRLGDGTVPIRSPVSVLRAVAAADPAFAATLDAADTTGDDRIPDRNVAGVYDALYRAAPERAAAVIERRGDAYRSLRIVVPTRQSAAPEAVTDAVRDAAATIRGDGGAVTATATGSDVILTVQVTILTENILGTLVVSLVAIFALLSLVYRLSAGSATLGAVTVLPIALVVAWVFGAMYLLGVPLTLFTALMMSLAVGLGVDYSIHVSERFAQELPDAADPHAALRTAVTGTGGALLGSTATTAGAFATMSLSSFPTLRQLGTMVGLSLVLSFVASVFVLPSLLVLWTRAVGADAIESA